MGASHTLVGIAGIAVCFAAAVTMRVGFDMMGADATDAPYTALFLYTPYVDPGQPVEAKIVLKGGDSISVRKVTASIAGVDGPVAIEDRNDRDHKSNSRSAMGHVDVELRAVVPKDTTAGEHVLAFDLETSCAGSSFARACGAPHIEAPIAVGNTAGARFFSLARALFAAAVVVLFGRRGWDPMKRWVANAGARGGQLLAPAFIAALVAWSYGGYPLFARPIGAALGSSSDVLFTVAILVWLAILPVAVRTRRRA